MKITKIEVIPFGIPIKDFADAYAGFASSNAVLVKIHTDEGTEIEPGFSMAAKLHLAASMKVQGRLDISEGLFHLPEFFILERYLLWRVGHWFPFLNLN